MSSSLIDAVVSNVLTGDRGRVMAVGFEPGHLPTGQRTEARFHVCVALLDNTCQVWECKDIRLVALMHAAEWPPSFREALKGKGAISPDAAAVDPDLLG